MSLDTQSQAPWYKQTWLWFVLAPVIAVVIYAAIFIYLAVTTSDGIVKDDYYKVAKGISVDTTRADAARALGLHGNLMIDGVTGDVQLQLQGNKPLPDTLDLDIVHPTHQKYDQRLHLRSAGAKGIYLASLQEHLLGKRYVIIEPANKGWQLRLEIHPPYDQSNYPLGNTP